MRIAFIGTGNMGGALLEGVLAAGQAPEDVHATTRSGASASALRSRLGVQTTALDADPRANRTAVDGAGAVFLGVKPWMLADTAADIGPALPDDAAIVSMAAGVDLATLTHHFPHRPVVRIMPNTPSSVGYGVIALASAPEAPAAVVDHLTSLLAGAGLVVPVGEEDMPTMIGASASGVAFFFLLAEHMVEAAVAQGLDEDTARRAVAATAEGAGRLLADTPDPAALRGAVTSAGGTTAAGIGSFEADGFADVVARAVRAAGDRSLEMEAENRAG
ncbi:pyrroline-5-carboxylate reductase [Brevibacterium yomogidense]|uniref:pyrroline-5-carboxylate reductase n=1 Tax=Brevibacterium yomogidense TaxID=946573 RepID=UPI0018DF95EF|nr:pyrroline-5-carboxylate reductase [Brevibacterium yomogidense]